MRKLATLAVGHAGADRQPAQAPASPQLFRELSDEADAADKAGDLATAVARAERALDLVRSLVGTAHPATFTTISQLALFFLRSIGSPRRGRAAAAEGLSWLRETRGGHHPQALHVLNPLTLLCSAVRRYDEAERLAESAAVQPVGAADQRRDRGSGQLAYGRAAAHECRP